MISNNKSSTLSDSKNPYIVRAEKDLDNLHFNRDI